MYKNKLRKIYVFKKKYNKKHKKLLEITINVKKCENKIKNYETKKNRILANSIKCLKLNNKSILKMRLKYK